MKYVLNKTQSILPKKLLLVVLMGRQTCRDNNSRVHRLISKKAGKEVPYIHFRVHILSLALISTRNKCPKIKRVFHILRDIYKLLRQSRKREEILHKV